MEDEKNVNTEKKNKYASYPEGKELLFKELKFPTEDEGMKRMLFNTTISTLIHM